MSDINVSTKIDKCIITGESVVSVLDLGQHSYADTFINEDQLNLSEPVFPLQVNLCSSSGHLQLAYVSHAEERYNLYSYSYTSSNSAFSRNHWDNYAREVKNRFSPTSLVVEVGSNDGYLVGQFSDSCKKVLGVDISGTMCSIAEDRGVPSVQGAFNSNLGKELQELHGYADVVIANNVLNHANDPVDFSKGAATLIGINGTFIFEMPYWVSMLESGRFVDQVYHEHISYFTMKSIVAMLSKADLVVADVEVVDYHGGSIRVYARYKTSANQSPLVDSYIKHEEESGYFTSEFYDALVKKFSQQRSEWLANFYRIKNENPNAIIIGVGAAAKAMTWLNYHGINKNDLCYITDSSEFKQGKYTALSRIPIVSDNIFAEYHDPYALVLSWNIGDRLKEILLSINPNIKFISQ